MTTVSYSLRDPKKARFVRGWLSVWIQLRKYCEQNLDYLRAEEGKRVPAPVSEATPRHVAAWCHTFQEHYGREMPAVVGAAASFHRDFLNLILAVVPELGEEGPGQHSSMEMIKEFHDPHSWTEKIVADSPDWESAVRALLSKVDEKIELLRSKRPAFNIRSKSPKDILDKLEEVYECRLRQLVQRAWLHLTGLSSRPLDEDGFLFVPTDPISEATIEVLARVRLLADSVADQGDLGLSERFRRARRFNAGGRRACTGWEVTVIGLKREPEEHFWELLQKNGALAIRAHYALWARAHAEGAVPGQYVVMPLSIFCDDLGFARSRGDHRPKSKEAAVKVLKFLTELEVTCLYQPTSGPAKMLEGPIWVKGTLDESLIGFRDVFSEKKEDPYLERRKGRQRLQVATLFSYSPGPIFGVLEWRSKFDRSAARISAGLLDLKADTDDKYAVIVGGYLAVLAQKSGKRTMKVRVRELVEKSGLFSVYGRTHPERMKNKLYLALDRLRVVGVIERWVRPDMKDDEDCHGDYGERKGWSKKWLGQSISITLSNVGRKKERKKARK